MIPIAWFLTAFPALAPPGHVAINLSRDDSGRRKFILVKFILVEMADYFDTVLLPRLKKVGFSPEWKDGRPKHVDTSEKFVRSAPHEGHLPGVLRGRAQQPVL